MFVLKEMLGEVVENVWRECYGRCIVNMLWELIISVLNDVNVYIIKWMNCLMVIIECKVK